MIPQIEGKSSGFPIQPTFFLNEFLNIFWMHVLTQFTTCIFVLAMQLKVLHMKTCYFGSF